MAENTHQDPYPTGVYVKGDKTRRATTTADAVQAVFDGFTRQSTEEDVAGPFVATNDVDAADDDGKQHVADDQLDFS